MLVTRRFFFLYGVICVPFQSFSSVYFYKWMFNVSLQFVMAVCIFSCFIFVVSCHYSWYLEVTSGINRLIHCIWYNNLWAPLWTVWHVFMQLFLWMEKWKYTLLFWNSYMNTFYCMRYKVDTSVLVVLYVQTNGQSYCNNWSTGDMNAPRKGNVTSIKLVIISLYNRLSACGF